MISVLYVDDESALLEVAKTFMEHSGEFLVDTATSAHEAIGKLKAGQYDAVVSDYLMPEMDGIELLKYLRPRCNGIPFIIFTGNGNEKTAIDSLNSGADYYLQKGSSPKAQFLELEARIRSAVARRQSERDLKKSEKRYRSIVETLMDVVFSTNAEGIITYISPRISQFGYEQKDLAGKDFAVIISAEDIPAVARHFEEIRQGNPVPFEFRVTDRSGRIRWVRCSCQARLLNGKFAGVDGLVSEITQHRDDDERLRLRERQYRELVETGTDGMLILDPESGLVLAFNDEACRQLGYSREEFARTPVKEWMGSDAPAAIRSWIASIKKEGSLFCGGHHRTKTGDLRSVKISAHLIENEEKNGLCLCIRDVTESEQTEHNLKKSEAALRDIYLQAPVAYVVLTPDGKIIEGNHSFVSFMGYPEAELTGKCLAEFIDPSRAQDFLVFLQDSVKTDNIRTVKYPLIRKEGDRRIVSVEARAGYEGDKSVRRIYCILSDVTESVEESKKLLKSAAESRAIIASAGEGIFSCGPDLAVTSWNSVMEEQSGIAAADAIGKQPDQIMSFFSGEPVHSCNEALAGKVSTSGDFRYEYPVSKKSGWARLIISPERSETGAIQGIVCIFQDVSDRRESEQRTRVANRIYSMITRVSSTGPQTRNLAVFLDDICSYAVSEAFFLNAWVGLYDQSADLLRPVAREGSTEDFPPKDGITVSGLEAGGWPAADAIRTGMPVIGIVSEALDENGETGSWEGLAHRQGCRSAAAVPFRLHGAVVGVFCIGSDEPATFTSAENEPLLALSGALSSVLDTLDRQAIQKKTGKAGKGSWERTRFLASALESTPVPFIIAYSDRTLGGVNTSACSLLGYPEDELLALHWEDIIRDPEEESGKDRIKKVISAGVPLKYRAECIRKDGSVIPVDISLQKMADETSGLLCVSAGICDMSAMQSRVRDLEEVSRRFQSFFIQGTAAMFIAGDNGIIRAANPASCSLFYRSESELVGSAIRDLLGQDPRFVGLMKTWDDVGRADGELRLMRSDGTLFDALIFMSTCTDITGNKVPGIILIDNTGRKVSLDEPSRCQELDDLPVPVRKTGPDGTCVYVNTAWRSLTGIRADEFAVSWTGMIHPDDRGAYQISHDERDRSHTPGSVEFRFMDKAGECRWLRETAQPDILPDGTVNGWIFSLADIDDAKKAQEALEGCNAYFGALFENSADGIVVIDDVITDCSASATTLTGYSREEILGKPLEVFAPEQQPGGQKSAAAVCGYLDAVRAGTPQQFTWMLKRKNGMLRETEIYLYPADIRGKDQAICIIDDVTEKHRAEHEIRHLAVFPQMDASPIIEITRDKKIVYTNPAVSDILHRLGMPPDPLAFLPQDFDTLAASLTGPGRQEACRMVRIKEAYFHEWICPSPDQTTFVVYAHDITDRVQASDALAYANHKLGILTSITRHDIKNKLTGITGYLSLMRSSVKDPQLITYLDRADAATVAIRHHIDFTKDYETLGETAPVWQNMETLIADIRANLDTGKTEVETSARDISIYADPMLSKVFYNLVDNSLRHGVHVRHIRISDSKTGDNSCLLVYEDDGIGVPTDKKEVIFERGYTTSTVQNPSSGLGLFLVRDILSITGITIRETGTPGEGVRFEMIVPPGKWKDSAQE